MPAHFRRLARDVRRTPMVNTLKCVQDLIAYKRTHIENEQRRLENERRRLMELEAMEARLLSVVK